MGSQHAAKFQFAALDLTKHVRAAETSNDLTLLRGDDGRVVDPGEYAALACCTYLNQASLGLIPRTSVAASARFLTDVAQHGNLRLSDRAEATVVDGLRTAAAGLLGAPVASVAVVGGASEGLGQLAALLSGAGVRWSWCTPTSQRDIPVAGRS